MNGPRTVIGRRVALAAALGAPVLSRPARAQGQEPVRILTAFPPGAATDGIARMLAERMIRDGTWGGTVLVDSRPGAGGNLAGALAARARPDGR